MSLKIASVISVTANIVVVSVVTLMGFCLTNPVTESYDHDAILTYQEPEPEQDFDLLWEDKDEDAEEGSSGNNLILLDESVVPLEEKVKDPLAEKDSEADIFGMLYALLLLPKILDYYARNATETGQVQWYYFKGDENSFNNSYNNSYNDSSYDDYYNNF